MRLLRTSKWVVLFVIVRLLLGSFVRAQTVFMQSTNSSGLLVIETEDFHTNTPHGGHIWAPVTNALASGAYAMAAQPNAGSNYDSGYIGVRNRSEEHTSELQSRFG